MWEPTVNLLLMEASTISRGIVDRTRLLLSLVSHRDKRIRRARATLLPFLLLLIGRAIRLPQNHQQEDRRSTTGSQIMSLLFVLHRKPLKGMAMSS